MNNLKEVVGVTEFFNFSTIVRTHQEGFENLYQLSVLPVEEVDNSNPQFFAQIEDILKPIFTAWQEKYDLIRQLTLEGIAQRGISGGLRLSLNNHEFATLDRYNAYDGAILVKPLKIHATQHMFSSEPELLACYTHHWRERHNLEVKYPEGKRFKTIIFKLEEEAFGKSFHGGKADSIYLEGEEFIGDLRKFKSGRSFLFSVTRIPQSFKPHPYRINDPSFHQTWE